MIPLGLAAVEIRALGDGPADLHRRLAMVAADLRQDPAVGNRVRDVFSAYAGIAIYAEPPIEAVAWKEKVAVLFRQLPQVLPEPKRVTVAVTYNGADLEELAAVTGLTVDDVLALHQAPTYSVVAIGFRPHFPYLNGLDPRLHCQRRREPRRRVPAGSVAIAGGQAGIYPEESPGGWNLLGSCDPGVCASLVAGDLVTFVEAGCG